MPGVITGQWAEAIEAWETALRAVGRPKTTVGLRTYHLRRFARESGTGGPWEVTTAHIEAWFGEQTWSRETRRSYRSSLRVFYAWGVRSRCTRYGTGSPRGPTASTRTCSRGVLARRRSKKLGAAFRARARSVQDYGRWGR